MASIKMFNFATSCSIPFTSGSFCAFKTSIIAEENSTTNVTIEFKWSFNLSFFNIVYSPTSTIPFPASFPMEYISVSKSCNDSMASEMFFINSNIDFMKYDNPVTAANAFLIS